MAVFPTNAVCTIGVGSGISTPDYSLFTTVVTDLQSAGWTQALTLQVLWASSANEIDQNFTLTSGVTHNNYRFTLEAGSGQSHVDNANFGTNRLAYVNSNGASLKRAVRFSISSMKTTVRKLQIYGASSTFYGIALSFSNAEAPIVDRCIIETVGANECLSSDFQTGTYLRVENSVIITNGGTGVNAGGAYGRSTDIFNSIIYNRGSLGSSVGITTSANGSVYNTAVIGFNTNCSNAISTGSNNATNKSSASNLPGSPILNVVLADAFVDVGASTYDLRLKSGSALIDQGTSSQGPTTDMGGRARSGSTDIGAFEFLSASSPIIFKPHYLRRLSVNDPAMAARLRLR